MHGNNRGSLVCSPLTADLLPDVYKAAAEEGVLVLGGSARTVGAAGGYLTGGGVSPFSHFYGLAVDSMYFPSHLTLSICAPKLRSLLDLLEVSLVNAKGESQIINEYTDPEYFYALRGGAGNAWGVCSLSISNMSFSSLTKYRSSLQ